MHSDTIFALSSAPGKAGVAVIRISGKVAFSALLDITKSPALPSFRQATLKKLFNADGSVLDHALVIAFPAPHSFTGEDVVELHIHGSMAITQLCLNRLLSLSGLRLAEPGEFTKRAFENGKFDLLEVEAIADVIDAETEAQARQALRQLEGHMGNTYKAMRHRILECLALLEAYIDFPEEDIPDSVIHQVRHTSAGLITDIEAALQHAHVGERVRSGFRIAIVGAPNAGKSSLLNALAKRDAAIVSPIAGTTRDVIEVRMNIVGYPVILSDTAGIRATEDSIELLGIERSKRVLDQADIIIFVIDSISPDLGTIYDLLPTGVPVIFLLNKIDQATDESVQCIKMRLPLSIEASVLYAQGLDTLEYHLANVITELQPPEFPIVTQARHKILLEKALFSLKSCMHPLPIELLCEDLRVAANKIGEITGVILPDEILGVIFSTFCIGK